MSNPVPGALIQLLMKPLQSGGVTRPTRTYLNFIGSGWTVADNPTNDSTDVSFTGGGGSTSVTGTGLWYSLSGTLNTAAVGLTGDATIGAFSGGNVQLTLAATGVTSGAYGSATEIPTYTVDLKGRLTAALNVPIALPPSQITQAGATTNQVLEWNGAAWAPASLPAGTSVTGTGLWYSSGGSLNGAAVDFSGDVSLGTLTAGNVPTTVVGIQGVAVPSLSAAGLLLYTGSVFQWTPQASVSVGGTGRTSLTAHSVLVGSGTSAVTQVGPSSSTGLPLVSQGSSSDPSFAALSNSGLATGTFSNITGVGTLGAGTASTGFTISASNVTWSGTVPVANVGHGTAGQILFTNGTPASAWTTLASGDVTSSTSTIGSLTVSQLSGATLIPVLNSSLKVAALGTQVSGTNGCLYLFTTSGGAPSSTNYVLSNNGSESFLNAAGDVQILIGGSQTVTEFTSTNVELFVSSLEWSAGTATPTISQLTPTSDVATNNLVIASQNPNASATVHTVGGGIDLSLPANVDNTTSSFPWARVLYGGSPSLWFGPLPGAVSGSEQAIFAAAQCTTPSSTNYSVMFNSGVTNVNANQAEGTGIVNLQAGGTTMFGCSLSSGTATFNFQGIATTTTAPSAGGAGALPATPKGYMTIQISGTSREIAYY